MNSNVDSHRIATLQDSQGNVYAITEFPFTIGRQFDANLCLKSSSVSRLHAQIDWEDDHYVLQDLGSTNGTWVNDQKIERVVLNNQDGVCLGDEALIFVLAANQKRGTGTQPTAIVDTSEDEDEDELDDALGESRNWFIWLVALVILLIMLGAAYFLFQIRNTSDKHAFASPASEVQQQAQQVLNGLDTPSSPPSLAELGDVLTGVKSADTLGPPVETSLDTQLQTPDQAQLRLQEIAAETTGVETQPQSDHDSTVAAEWPELPASKPETESKASEELKAVDQAVPASPKSKTVPTKPQKDSINAGVESTKNLKITASEKALIISEAKNISEAKKTAMVVDPIQLYLKGKAPDALALLKQKIAASKDPDSKARLMTQQQELQALYNKYQQGMQAFTTKEKDQAYTEWVEFIEKEKKFLAGYGQGVSQEKSVYVANVAKKVAKEFLARGQVANTEKRFADAYRYWALAAKFGDLPEAHARLAKIDELALQMYQQALAEETKNPQQAEQLWQDITRILPSDHDLYTKSNAKLLWSQHNKVNPQALP